jgi:hypothetical protein
MVKMGRYRRVKQKDIYKETIKRRGWGGGGREKIEIK